MCLTSEYLVLVDADKVHDYVFGPHELKLIRGGSRVQRDLAENVLPKILESCGGQKIFAGGGRVLGRFESLTKAVEFRDRAQVEFRERTHVATATAAIAEYEPARFREGVALVQSRLERLKAAGGGPVFAGGNSFFRSCEKCGRHPASQRAEQDDQFVCAGCRARLDWRSREERSPEDFEAIAKLSRPEGYLALLYLDMDRLGRTLAQHGVTEEAYRMWSTTIDRAVQHAAREALRRTSVSEDGSPMYEVLLMGGDDAVIAMSPQLIFAFAGEFQRLLNEACDGKISPRPWFSMGILIAHHHYPIREFVDGSERLMRSAKGLGGADSVDFAVLTQSMTDSPVSGRDFDSDMARRTAKPYRLEDFVELGSKAKRLKAGVGSSRLRQIGRMLGGWKLQAEVEYGYMVARSTMAERKLLVQEIGWTPYRETASGRFESPLGDIVELWRLV